ncbi:MAG: MFS transporter, partial [Clostridia bacterium]|nr:MFS transporter [Clostridia bacterium]
DVSGAVMGTQFAASYVGTMSMPPLFGLLADRVGASVFPGFLAVLFAGFIFCMIRIVRVLKQRGRYE